MLVLIVEDNSKMRELLHIYLNGIAEVCECSDGDEVLAMYTQRRPAWVVMDVQMERMGGIAATRLLKAAYPDSRVVMLSKHDDEELKCAAREAGALHYLLKDDLNRLRNFLSVTTIAGE